MEYKDPGRYIPIIYLLYSWGSLFGVPSRVPLPYTRGNLLEPRCCNLVIRVYIGDILHRSYIGMMKKKRKLLRVMWLNFEVGLQLHRDEPQAYKGNKPYSHPQPEWFNSLCQY